MTIQRTPTESREAKMSLGTGRPAQLQWEGIVQAEAQEDPDLAQPLPQGRQGGRTLFLREHLNGAALDDDVVRTGTYRGIQQVAGDELDAPTRQKHWSIPERAMVLPLEFLRRRFRALRGSDRDVQCGHGATRVREFARLLRDAIPCAEHRPEAVLGHQGDQQLVVVDR
jgi:hypothetical protein